MWGSSAIIVNPHHSGTLHQRTSSEGDQNAPFAAWPLIELELREKRAAVYGEKRSVVNFLTPVSKVGRCNSQVFFLKLSPSRWADSTKFLPIIWGMSFATFDMTFYCTDLLGHRIRKSQICNMQIVTVHGLTPRARFQTHRSKTVGSSEGQNLTCIIYMYILTLSGDLTWPGPEKSARRCNEYKEEATENLVALPLTIFYLGICEKPQVGLIYPPPPPPLRGLIQSTLR